MPNDLSDYLRAFGGIDQAAQQDNPYAPIEQISNTVNPAIYQAAGQSTKGVGAALVAGLLSGLVGGTGENLGKQFVGNQQDLAAQAMRDMQSGNAISPGGMSRSVFSQVQQLGAAKQMADSEEKQQLLEKTNLELMLNTAKAHSENPYLADRGTPQIKMDEKGGFSFDYGAPNIASGGMGGMGGTPPATAPVIGGGSPSGKNFLGIPITSANDQATQEFIKQRQMGAPAGAAEDAGKSAAKGARDEQAKAYKDLEDNVSKAQMLQTLANEAEYATKNAYTGPGAGMAQLTAQAEHSLTPGDTPEADAKLRAYGVFDKIVPEAFAVNGDHKGLRITNPREFNAFVNSLPSKSSSGPENEQKIDLLRGAVKSQQDYADLLSYGLDNSIPRHLLDRAWNRYSQLFPLMKETNAGYVPNSDAPSILDVLQNPDKYPQMNLVTPLGKRDAPVSPPSGISAEDEARIQARIKQKLGGQ
jgi:hypothetical protein